LQDFKEFEYVMIDSTIIRAHQHATGAKGGQKTRHWDAVVADFQSCCDALGNPLRFVLTPGQESESNRVVERLFNKLKHDRRIAIRYEQTSSSYLGFLALASTMLWLS
jgi:transposase